MALTNVKRETAARMIAEDRETDYQIAKAVGVSLRTIQYWKRRPDVSARIEQIADEVGARLDEHYERFEWLREKESLEMQLNGKSDFMKHVALARLREMGAI